MRITRTSVRIALAVTGLGLGLCVGWDVAIAATAIPPYITAAVADPDRPATDRERDALRKPAELIAFAGMKPGDRVLELIPGRGYFTQIFCRVVGSAGHVYTLNVKPARMPPGMSIPPAPPAPPEVSRPCTNISAEDQPAGGLKLAGDLDIVWTSQNYHDLHSKMFEPGDVQAIDKAVFAALKPGGVFIVDDHVAAAGSGARDTETLHRIDPALVKAELIQAGFELVAQSDLLRNPDDPHTAASRDLHDKSDKFLFKFRKPAH